ncbi:hypothetical protein GCM10009780_39150 [Actinomadura alba]
MTTDVRAGVDGRGVGRSSEAALEMLQAARVIVAGKESSAARSLTPNVINGPPIPQVRAESYRLIRSRFSYAWRLPARHGTVAGWTHRNARVPRCGWNV